jgi:autotransporter-associated beta strand protein
MNLRRILLIISAVIAVPAAASAHGVTVNVDLNAAGTKLILDRPVYADRDVTAITNLDQSLGYDQDDDVPGFGFSSAVLSGGGVISLRVVGPTHFWNPTSQLQASSTSSVVLDSLTYFAPATGGNGPVGESVAGQTSISSTLPVALYDPAAPPASDHHFAAFDLTAGAAGGDPSPGAYGLMVELVDTTASGTIISSPFMIGVNNGLTHAVSSFGAAGTGDHQQPSGDGTQYGAAVAAFQTQLANTVIWNFNGGGNYSAAAKWDGNPLQGAVNAGTTIVFGDGSSIAINVASAVVTIDGAYTAGSLIFDNIGGTNYTLAGDGVTGHGLTLNNNGAGASVNVLGGNHTITTPVTLAEPAVFNIASGASLVIAGGQIGETAAGTPFYMTGGGTLSVNSLSLYSGATTISGGTLQTSAQGSIGGGPLVLNTDNYVSSAFVAGRSQSVASLAITGDGSGTATLAIAGGQTLTVQQPLAQDPGTKLAVSGNGRLRFAASGGSATAGAGASVSVASGATLELAGSVSALSSQVNVINDSDQSSGGALLVSGPNQQIGNLDGSGDLLIAAGGELTANHVIQDAIVIEGTASSPAILTIAESDSAVLAADGSFDRTMLEMPAFDTSINLPADSTAIGVKASATGALENSSVPEPTTFALALFGLVAAGFFGFRSRRHSPN